MDPPTPPPPLDLNLLPAPKLEPKTEPLDENPAAVVSFLGPETPTPNPNPNPNPSSLLSPEVRTPLQQIPPDPDEEDLFSEYFRLARLFLASYAGKLRPSSSSAAAADSKPPNPNANSSIIPAADSASTGAVAVSSSKKRKQRSANMVRVSALALPDLMYFRDLVRRTRITYESLRTLLIRSEDRSLEKTTGARADLKAAALMTERDLWLNRDKRIIGPIPGVAVGDVFFFRMELCVVGVHGQVQAGIDYVPGTRSPSGEPVATSIIVSGGYEDDDDGGDVIIYTGAGGRDRNVHRHCGAQTLARGNLALERSMNYGIEIRVIRGIKSDRSPSGRVYVYDGLYRVVDCWVDTGKSGFDVYKYKLVRMDGQEEMGSGILKMAVDLKANPLGVRPNGYLSLDVSMGKENCPVSLFNDIDDDRDPLLFEYIARPKYPPKFCDDYLRYYVKGGCACVANCTSECECGKKNGGEFAYDANGILSRGKPLVYECGTSCGCPPSCPNRVSQKGVKYQLEIFRSRETGWGVRSLDLIRAGSFICEFSGIVLTKQQSKALTLNGDHLVYPSRFPARWAEWGDISSVWPEYMPPNFPTLPGLSFSIDVSRARNVACYLSHSCSPNVFVQFVLFDHYNQLYPHLMIFALENIPPLRELSVDYGAVDECVERLTL